MDIKSLNNAKSESVANQQVADAASKVKEVGNQIHQLARDAVVVTVVHSSETRVSRSPRGDSYEKMRNLSEDVAHEIRRQGKDSLAAHDGVGQQSSPDSKATQ